MILLIDLPSIFARTYFRMAGTDEAKEGGKYFGAWGTVNYLLTFIRDYEPSHLACALDSDPTERRKLYGPYKAERTPKPPDYYQQFELLVTILEKAGILVHAERGWEADDVLGSWGYQLESPELASKLIVTGDKDLLQLVDEAGGVYVELLTWNKEAGSGRKRFTTDKDVRDELGVWPDQVVMLKAMVGDSSDNYPGAKGVGAKKAIPLLNQHGTLGRIYDNLYELRTKAGKPSALAVNLTVKQDMVYLCLKLALINLALDVPTDLSQMTCPTSVDIHRAVASTKERLR